MSIIEKMKQDIDDLGKPWAGMLDVPPVELEDGGHNDFGYDDIAQGDITPPWAK